MDFFDQQDRARKKTGMLVGLFILAVCLVIFAVYAAVMGVVIYNSSDPNTAFFHPQLFFTITVITLAVIAIGSAIKISALSKGGGYVAERLGGTLVSPSTRDPDQRRLLNVVEEMAIASGTPVPPVYLLEAEPGINAFAAGFTPSDAVIGITRGACQQLTREELQGVIAHEFSHILNGDMRLNIRLMGYLGGIMVISAIGETILRSTNFRSSRSGRSGKGGGQVLILAFLLLVIGYLGVLIGRLIQSAVSRQREYLADASAVQFTRSTGIADALKKIGGFPDGSEIESPGAGEACHMFFGRAIWSLFATHPPLVDRIRKIEPGFTGVFITETIPAASMGDVQPLAPMQAGQSLPVQADTVKNSVGNITPDNVAYSAAVLAAIPEPVKEEAKDILGAWAVVCALLLDKAPEQRENQIRTLGKTAPDPLLRQLAIVTPRIKELAPELRLPVLDIAISTLRQMSSEQHAVLQDHIRILVEADGRMSLFEFVLKEVIHYRLQAVLVPPGPKVPYRNISPLADDAAVLLSALAHAGHRERSSVQSAFQAAVAALPLRGEKMTLRTDASFKGLHQALERFARASFGVKKAIFGACCQCVLFDGTVSITEAELLRAVAYAVGIPVPPFAEIAGIRQ